MVTLAVVVLLTLLIGIGMANMLQSSEKEAETYTECVIESVTPDAC